MKRFTYFYILVCVLMQAGGNALLVLQYSINKEYITETFCINKEIPALDCQGSCHLRKQLKHSNSSKQQQLKLAADIVWMYQPGDVLELLPATIINRELQPPYTASYCSLSGGDIEHPPQLFMHA